KAARAGSANRLLILVEHAERKAVVPIQAVCQIVALAQRKDPPGEKSIRSIPGERAARGRAEEGGSQIEVEDRIGASSRAGVGGQKNVAAFERPAHTYRKRVVAVSPQVLERKRAVEAVDGGTALIGIGPPIVTALPDELHLERGAARHLTLNPAAPVQEPRL